MQALQKCIAPSGLLLAHWPQKYYELTAGFGHLKGWHLHRSIVGTHLGERVMYPPITDRLTSTQRRHPSNNTESFRYIEGLCGGMWNVEVKVWMFVGIWPGDMAGDVLIMCRWSRR